MVIVLSNPHATPSLPAWEIAEELLLKILIDHELSQGGQQASFTGIYKTLENTDSLLKDVQGWKDFIASTSSTIRQNAIDGLTLRLGGFRSVAEVSKKDSFKN